MKETEIIIKDGNTKKELHVKDLVRVESLGVVGLIVGFMSDDVASVFVFLETPCVRIFNKSNLNHWTGTITITNK